MTGEERRGRILNAIRQAGAPVPGAALARDCHVSRQVIVQDIALLRAAQHPILSTTRGYVLQPNSLYTRVFRVQPPPEGLGEILFAVVDNGGRVRDIFQPGAGGGRLEARLDLRSRREVQDFLRELSAPESAPLRALATQPHCHTVEAESGAVLDRIEATLSARGCLLPGGARKHA